jgi:DNA-binding NarL/FixJ family response regulator
MRYDGACADEVVLHRERCPKMPVDTPAQIESLTTFELGILQDKACGLTDAEVGKKRNNASAHTVKTWLWTIYEKLGYHEDEKEAQDIKNSAARAVCTVLRAKKITGPAKKGRTPNLDRDELSVLDFVSLGYGSPQIAEYLPFGEETVKARLNSAGGKLGVSSPRVQIAAAAIVHGLI